MKALILARAETAPFKPGQKRADSANVASAANDTPPLYKDLGNLHYAVSTTSAKAQAYFDQGLRLMFAFNHAESARAFREAQRLDPQCAMCFWGEALVLGPNINAPMFPEAVAPAVAAAQRAVALSANASESERMLIAAVAKRYSADPKAGACVLKRE